MAMTQVDFVCSIKIIFSLATLRTHVRPNCHFTVFYFMFVPVGMYWCKVDSL